MIFDIGRVCIKTHGRDAKRHCVVIDVIDDTMVLVDGNTRRKKVNITHLEPMDKTIDVKKKATTEEVLKGLSDLGFKVKDLSKKKEKKPVKAPEKKEEPAKVAKAPSTDKKKE